MSFDFFNRSAETDSGERSAEYAEFLKKFEAKKTTDDCFTPPLVYDAVADFVESHYRVSRDCFVRPFYPGGSYVDYPYKPDSVVVDNPPFSILSKILNHYNSRGIKYFLFAPALTLFSSSATRATALPIGADITYENGASVLTSFVTNMEPDDVLVCSYPDLYRAVHEASEESRKQGRVELPKYEYPDHVVTAAMVQRWCKYGVPYRLTRENGVRVGALDAQRKQGKSIFGSGFLLSERAAAERAAAERAAAERAAAERAAAERAAAERAAAERAAAERAAAERAAAERAAATKWQLSDREREIIKMLGGHDGNAEHSHTVHHGNG